MAQQTASNDATSPVQLDVREIPLDYRELRPAHDPLGWFDRDLGLGLYCRARIDLLSEEVEMALSNSANSGGARVSGGDLGNDWVN